MPDDPGARPPALLFVPTAARRGAAQDVELALKPLVDGRLAMLLFTSLDSLVAGCGPAQPWVALPEAAVEDAFRLSPAEVVMVDVALAADQRWGTS